MESDIEPTEQLKIDVEDIPNLVDARMEVNFHGQSVGRDMEIAEHLVVDDLVVVADVLYVAEHLVVSNEIASVVSLTCVDGDLHVASDPEFVVAGVHSLVADVDESLLVKHYVQFVLGCEHSDWVADMYLILMFWWMKYRWLIFIFFLLTLMNWKPLVKMKMIVYLSLGIKLWDILFYLLGESDARASSLNFGGVD